MQSNEMSTEALRGEEERHVFKIIIITCVQALD